MSQWTDSARAKLEEYLGRMRQTLAASGADINEVTEDLRRHVEQEAAARKLAIITEQDVAQILARVGLPDGSLTGAPPAERVSPPPTSPPNGTLRAKASAGALLLFGVLLPLGTLCFEFFTGACAGLLFDPIPGIAHLVLVALVPLINLATWVAVLREDLRWQTWLGWANGFAIGVALVYALLFLPVTPFAVIGILYLGFGFLPLTPLLALVCALLLRRRLRRAGGAGLAPLPGLWRGLAVGVGALALLTLPMLITKAGLELACSDSVAESLRGIRWLRDWGRNEELLRACYGRAGRAGELYAWGRRVSPEAARGIYYRVNGRPFNSVPPPKLYAGRGRWNIMEEEFTWDDEQGGSSVGGRLRGLSLVSSRQDAAVDPAAALGYVEWTLEFKNDSRLQREARAQIWLPRGGVVSRLTLWIDDEAREAAFGGRSQVKGAYQAVVQKRRDPVLVTTCGPDRVLLQCFPVPPGGGRMKVRLGMTAPLALTAADTGYLRWPCFIERNFTIPNQVQHSLWAQSPLPIETAGRKLSASLDKGGGHSLRGQLRDVDLAAPANAICVRRPPELTRAWTRDTREGQGQLIRQTIVVKPAARPDRVVLVLDGTQETEAYWPALGAALGRFPADIEFALLLARDGCEEMVPLQKGAANVAGRLQHGSLHHAGGHDNVPALVRAWEVASAAKTAAILWVHGPQPVLFDSTEGLRQRLERGGSSPALLEIQTEPGPNRVLEKLDGLKPVRSILQLGDLGDDLGRVFAAWSTHASVLTIVRERVESGSVGDQSQGTETSMHLARLWAAEEVSRLAEARQFADATRLAARYQLVTPFSGAVVLETQAQYASAGLQPVPPESVPTVPEPSAAILWLIGFALLVPVLRRRREHDT